MKYTWSQRLTHFFHVVSNIRPITWIGLYVIITPLFALVYWLLPEGQFRIPDGGEVDYGSWLYYSIVTITTLGFGDYTPMHPGAQAVTAVEVMCGLIFLGLFLNAVGAMKSEIDVESEIEKQKQTHFGMEREKLIKTIPTVIHSLNIFLSYCYAVTTPSSKRGNDEASYNPDFSFNDLADMFHPSGLPIDRTNLPAVTRLLKSASQTCLAIDSLQTKVDLTLWPEILEDCFGFVANCQMFSNTDVMFSNPDHLIFDSGKSTLKEKEAELKLSQEIASYKGNMDFDTDSALLPVAELYYFIKENASLATKIEAALAEVATSIK